MKFSLQNWNRPICEKFPLTITHYTVVYCGKFIISCYGVLFLSVVACWQFPVTISHYTSLTQTHDASFVHSLDIPTELLIWWASFGVVANITRVHTQAFSPDAHWLVTASMDCTVRTWDLPSARYHN